MPELTLTRAEHATIREAADREMTRAYGIPIPPDCPLSIRTKIIAERARRLGLHEIKTCLEARVVDTPEPAQRSASAPQATDETEEALLLRQIDRL